MTAGGRFAAGAGGRIAGRAGDRIAGGAGDRFAGRPRPPFPHWPLLALALAVLVPAAAVAAEKLNGFSLEKLSVPRDLLRAGGPVRDQIRSVDAPRFVAAGEATWMPPEVVVIGLERGGEARAYPVHLVERHQIVNDGFGGEGVAVVYDPLAGQPTAFLRRIGDRTLSFGVSGLVYNGAFLLFDRETESLWSPFLGRAIAGPLAGRTLERLRVRQESAASWTGRFPATKVLAPPEPQRIDYRYSPYSSHWVTNEIPFPVAARDERFHAKEIVLGAVVGGKARGYLGSRLTAAGGEVRDQLEGRTLHIRYDSESGVLRWDAPPDVVAVESYWYAWKAFRPDTEVWEPKP